MRANRAGRDESPATAGQPATTDPTGDLRIVELARDDPQAFAPLYERYAAPVYYFCFRRLNHPEDAADATAIVFTKALASLARFQAGTATSGSTFRAWLYAIARNVVTDVHRRSRNHASLDVAVPPLHTSRYLIDRSLGPEDQALGAEEARLVTTLLRRLPDRQCAVVELRLAGLSIPETASVLGVTESAAKALQVRAYRTLRELLHSEPAALTREHCS
jgi:RNA polymerase sigma-70 factor (ECF subfamily)